MIEDRLRARATEEPGVTRDLTDLAQNAAVLTLADELLVLGGGELVAARSALLADPEFVAQTSAVFLEALASAVGKLHLQQAVQRHQAGLSNAGPASGERVPLRVSAVFAMYGEGARILPSDDNPHGEDFLRTKVAQLDWLFDRVDPAVCTWHLIAVDDGCPDVPSSSELAADIVADEGLADRVSVLKLADAIEARTTIATPSGGNEAFSQLRTPADSRKGGSILYGLWWAAERFGYDRTHIALFTDADLSANLTQLGSLVARIVDPAGDQVDSAIGQRYGLSGSVLVKGDAAMTEPRSTGTKPDKLIVLFRHQVRAALIPGLSQVLDTQAGFKAFTGSSLARTLPLMRSFNETFDVELLIHTDHQASAAGAVGGRAIAVEPIVFTEDFAQTNFPSVEPGARHLAMVQQIVEVYDSYVAEHSPVEGEAAQLLEACRSLSVDDYVSIIEQLKSEDHGWPEDALFDRPLDIPTVLGLVSSS